MEKKDKKLLIRIILLTFGICAVSGVINKSYASLLGAVGVIGIGIIFVYAVQVLIVAFRINWSRFNFWSYCIKHRTWNSGFWNKEYIL